LVNHEVRILGEVYDLGEAYVKIKVDEFVFFKNKIDDIQRYWVGVLMSAKKERDELPNAQFKARFKEWFFNCIEHRIEQARDMIYLWESKRKMFCTDRDIYIDEFWYEEIMYGGRKVII
jgi:hypothetical protein